MKAHPDVELVLFGEMILGHYNPGGMPEYHRKISEPIPGPTTQALGERPRISASICVLGYLKTTTDNCIIHRYCLTLWEKSRFVIANGI